VTAGTTGKVNAEAHVFEGAVMTGAEGKITTLAVLLTVQGAGPADPAWVFPQAEAST